jgi:hypothetical protein
VKKLFLLFFLLAQNAFGTTYWVGKSGSNANSCGTASGSSDPGASNRKLTIRAGIQCMSGGDTLQIGNGTYFEAIRDVFSNSVIVPSGSAGSPTTIRAENRRLAILQTNDGDYGSILMTSTRHYVTFNGLVLNHAAHLADDFGGINIGSGSGTDELDHIIIQDCEVYNARFGIGIGSHVQESAVHDNQVLSNYSHNNDEYGLYLGGVNTIVDGNDFFDNDQVPTGQTQYNLHHYGNNGGVNGHIIRNNRFRCSNCAKANVLLASGSGNYFYNNIIWGGSGAGIWINYDADSNFIYNNTIYGNTGSYCVDDIDSLSTGNEFKNNICYLNGSDTVHTNGGTITTATNVLGSNPFFTNAAGEDFSLTASSTAAIDQGTTLSVVTSDFVGHSRTSAAGSAYDIGAYEYDQAPPNSTISVTSPVLGAIERLPNTTTLQWTTTGISSGTVTITYSFDSFVTSYSIASGVAYNASPFTFTPTWPKQTAMQVKICQASVCGTSAAFETRGAYLK